MVLGVGLMVSMYTVLFADKYLFKIIEILLIASTI